MSPSNYAIPLLPLPSLRVAAGKTFPKIIPVNANDSLAEKHKQTYYLEAVDWYYDHREERRVNNSSAMLLKPFDVFRPDIPRTVWSSCKLRNEHKTEASPGKSFQTSPGLLEVQTDEYNRLFL